MITKIIYQFGNSVENYTVGEYGVVSISNIESEWMGLFEIILGNSTKRYVNKQYVIEFWMKNTP